MAEISNVMRDLLKGKNITENFPIFYNELTSLYNRQATVQFALEYYNFCEIAQESGLKIFPEFCENIKTAVASYFTDTPMEAEDVLKIRSELIRGMETITWYSDRFGKYEYILNRVEYRFKKSLYDDNYYVNELEKDIYNYIFSDKDNAMINTRIAEIVGELPMRLSKNKFFDLIRNTYTIYKNSERKSLDDYDYSLRVAGGICIIDDANKVAELDDLENKLSLIDFDSISEDEYNRARELCEKATQILETMVTFYMNATVAVNKLSVMLLCKDSFSDVNFIDKIKASVDLSEKIYAGKSVEEDEITKCFTEFEGIQENVSRRLDGPENALEEITQACKDKGFDEQLNTLFVTSRLMSTSTFADLVINDNKSDLVDAEYASYKSEEIERDFMDIISNSTRAYKRAVMAAVVSMLPVFFNNTDEIQQYIHVSLTQCTDDAEKKAVMEIVGTLMIGKEE